MGVRPRKLYHWRSGIVLLIAAIFSLGIPSLPHRDHHLLFWVIAFLIEAALIVFFCPFDSD
jgi:hypothetical protein